MSEATGQTDEHRANNTGSAGGATGRSEAGGGNGGDGTTAATGARDSKDEGSASRDIRVLFADDDQIIREGLANLLNHQEGITVVATAEDGAQALDILATQTVDVALIDVDMPVLDGIQTAQRIARRYPDLAVVILTAFEHEESFVRSLEQNVRGFLTKDIPPDRLAEQLKRAHAGERVFGPRPTEMLTSNFLAASSNAPEYRDFRRRVEALPPYLRDVFDLVIEAYPNKTIARRLKLSENTVRTYVSQLFIALDFTSRNQLTITALKAGY